MSPLIITRKLGILLLTMSLAGCAANSGTHALLDAWRLVFPGDSSGNPSFHPNPRFKYLRLQIGKREAFVALGYVEQHPEGAVEVWYSASDEVLRLLDGRIVGASVTYATSWLSVEFDHLPRWNEIKGPVTFGRSRDVRPGYQYGLREQMLIQPIPAPADSELREISPASLNWFEERAKGEQGTETLPPARYGVDPKSFRVVYAEQCLSQDFCLSWQRWPPSDK